QAGRRHDAALAGHERRHELIVEEVALDEARIDEQRAAIHACTLSCGKRPGLRRFMSSTLGSCAGVRDTRRSFIFSSTFLRTPILDMKRKICGNFAHSGPVPPNMR